MVPSTTSSPRSISASAGLLQQHLHHQAPMYLKAEIPTAFATRRSSRACAVPRPTRGACAPNAMGGRFTRRTYSRSSMSSRQRIVGGASSTATGGSGVGGIYGQAASSTTRAASSEPQIESSSSTPKPQIEEISSSRGRNAVSLLPVYLTDARAVTKYHPIDAPNGALQLSVAENQMLEDLLVPAIQKYSVDDNNNGNFESDQIYYQPTHGRPSLRDAMASYLERILNFKSHAPTSSLDREGLVLGAGCNAVLENLCFCLTEPGDAVLIPTPYYAAFEFDLVARVGLNIVPVNTMEYNSPSFTSTPNSIPQSWYYPTVDGLNAAYESAKQAGSTPKILLLSHPNNPLGVCYPKEVVKECIDWARSKKVHLISDEIYAGSVYRKTNPLTGEDTFQSALTIATSATDYEEKKEGSSSENEGLGLGPYIHFVYALSKDFALSGLRVGVAYSENKAIRLPMQKVNDLCQISSQTQQTIEQMLSASSSDDSGFWSTDEFLPLNNDRIRERSDRLQLCLEEFNIPNLFGDSALFLWMDLSEFLPPSSDEPGEESEESKDKRERELYLELVQKFGLLFTPGRSMRNELPGYFRCVFTAASDEEFDLGLERIKAYVTAKRSTRD